MTNLPDLFTIKQFSDRHAAFTPASLRWLRFNSAQNGFATAFKKVGRRVLIDESEFFATIERQNSTQESRADGCAIAQG